MGRGPRVRRAENASVLGEVSKTLRKHPMAEDGRGEDTEAIDKHRLGAGRLALGAGRVIPHPDLGNICAGPTAVPAALHAASIIPSLKLTYCHLLWVRK